MGKRLAALATILPALGYIILQSTMTNTVVKFGLAYLLLVLLPLIAIMLGSQKKILLPLWLLALLLLLFYALQPKAGVDAQGMLVENNFILLPLAVILLLTAQLAAIVVVFTTKKNSS